MPSNRDPTPFTCRSSVMPDAIDQVARDTATRALYTIEAHERECDMWRKESVVWRERLDDAVGRIHSGLLKATIMVVTLLVGIISFLITHTPMFK